MPNLNSKSIIHLLTNVKYGIIRRPILIKLIMINYLSNYIPDEIIICDDRDPPWINNRVKELINEKSDTFQCYLHSNKDPKLFSKVEYLQNELKSLIEANMEKY